MKKAELKKLIKPVVKECIQEVLIEEGLLTEVVSQVAAGLSRTQLVENSEKKSDNTLFNEDLQMKRKAQEVNEKLQAHRKSLLNSIGADAYNGVDIFEGTQPLRESGTAGESHTPSVLGENPNDAGVDISSLVGGASKVWKALK